MKPLLEQINEIRNEQGLDKRAKGTNNRANGCTKRGTVVDTRDRTSDPSRVKRVLSR